jgi:uncharacterized protein with NRDE domain
MNVLVETFLNSDLVGTKTVEIIVSSDESTVRVIENKN